jgi:ankyrin repeat protein
MIEELLRAIEKQDITKVQELLSAGVDVNSVSYDDEFYCDFPLGIACSGGSSEIVKLLIENGANVNQAEESEFHTPLMYASGDREIIELLLKHGADVNAEDDYNATALTRAAESGRFEIVKLLLEHGANPGVREERGKTAAELAEERGYFEIAALIRTKSS